MIKIAFDEQIFSQQYGGISRYYSNLASELYNINNNIKIFAGYHVNNHLKDIENNLIIGKKIKSYPNKFAQLITRYNRISNIIKINKWEPDIIHETYYSRININYNKCPLILTVYDMIHEKFKEDFSDKDNTATIKKKAIKRADHIICISENTKKDLIEILNVEEMKISVIYLSDDKKYYLKTIKKDDRIKPYLLFVGNRKGYKNFNNFIKAVSLSKNLMHDFDIISFGSNKFENEELENIQKLGYKENQVQHKIGDDSILNVYYRNASALIYPSKYEGFGIPPLEAMTNECPVITSNCSSIPEICENAAEYFDPYDCESIKKSIEKVVYSNSRKIELIKLGKSRTELFGWKKCALSTDKVYKTVLENK